MHKGGPSKNWQSLTNPIRISGLHIFLWTLKSLWMVTAATKLKDAPWKESCDEPRQYIKKQRHHFANKGP